MLRFVDKCFKHDIIFTLYQCADKMLDLYHENFTCHFVY